MFKIRQALAAAAALTLVCSTAAEARRSIPNPMTPRVLNEAAYHQDYTYGYTKLSGNAIDTLEDPNRLVGWNLNYYVFDRYILRPIAHGYAMLPQPVQTGVGNFLGNLNEVNYFVNNLFIGEPAASLTSLGRFGINTTVGILGIFDVASVLGLERAPMDMSTVLGRAGMDQGPFLMIPVYGPTTARELHGDAIDDMPYWFAPFWVNAVHWALSGIHSRAQFVEQEGVVDNSFDPYVTTRDMYLMYAEGLVNPDAAMQTEEEEFLDEEFLDEID